MLLSEQGVILVFGLIAGWLIALSFVLYRIIIHYRQLIGKTKKGDLESILETILKEQQGESEGIEALIKRVKEIEEKGEFHLQKMGLVRFNPFSETGGNQSFTLAILDGENSGIVVSSLHTRDNTRIYAKAIKEGKPIGPQFSKEENEAIKQAQKFR